LEDKYKNAIRQALTEWSEKTDNIFCYKLNFVDMSTIPADTAQIHTHTHLKYI